MADDRYGLSAFFEFTTKGNSLATLDRVEAGLRNLENTIRNVSRSVASSSLGTNISQQLDGVGRATSNASNQISSFARSTTSHLNPLKSEFRALRAEARNIDFGDLDDPATFNIARTQIHGYIDDLKELESQVTGNTAADRQFRAELIRNQSIASNNVDIADSQRRSAIASQKAGTSTAIAGGAAAVALPAIGLGTAAVNITAGFDDQMSAVAAVLSAQDRTSENMLKLREQAKSIGAATKFSATDAAAGLVLLAQSGQTVNEQLKSIGGTTLLAAAGGLDLAAATDITVSALGQFGLKADDAVHVANVLAYNAGAANLDVSDLGESLKYAGPAAAAFGASFEETNAILDVFSESGIKASAAGTALRSIFLGLAKPSSQAQKMMDQYGISVKDASGNMLSTVDVVGQLQQKLSGLNSADKLEAITAIFGKEASTGALALVNGGADKMKNYLKGGENVDTVKGSSGAVGSAAVQAGIMEDNIGGSFRNLSSAIEGVQIEMGEVLIPTIRLVTNTLSSLLTRFIELPKPIKTAITITAALVTGLAAVTAVVASGAAVFFTLQSAIGASSIAATLMSSTLIPLTGFANAAMASFGAAGFAGSLGVLSGAFTTIAGSIAAFGAGIFAAITSPFALATAGILALYAGLELLTPGFNVLGSVLTAIATPFALVIGFVKGVAEAIGSALAPVLGELGKFKAVAGPIGEAFTIASAAFSHFTGVGEMVGKVVGGAIGIGILVPLRALIGLVKLASASTVTLGQFGAMIAAPFISSVQWIQGAWQGFIDWFLQMPLVQFAKDLGNGLINALNHNPTVKIPIAWEGAVAKITGLFGDLLVSGIATAANIIAAFNPIALIESIPSIVSSTIGSLTAMGTGLWSILTGPFEGMMAAGSEAVAFLSGVWQGFGGWLQNTLLSIPKSVASAFSKILPPFMRTEDKTPEATQSAPIASVEMPKFDGSQLEQMRASYIAQIQTMGIQGKAILQSSIGSIDGSAIAAKATPAVNTLSALLTVANDGVKAVSGAMIGFGLATFGAMSPAVLVVGALVFAVAAVSANFLGLRTILSGLVQVIQGVFTVLHGVIETFTGLYKVARSTFNGIIQIAQGIPAAFRGDFSQISIAFSAMTGGIREGFGTVFSGFERAGSGFKTAFNGMIKIGQGFGEAIHQVFVGLPRLIGKAVTGMGELWRSGAEIISSIPFVPAIEALKTLPAKVSGIIEKVSGNVRSGVAMISEGWESLKLHFPNINLGMFGEIPNTVKAVASGINEMWGIVKLKFPAINTDIFEKAESVVRSASNIISELWGAIKLRLPFINTEVLGQVEGSVRGSISSVTAIWDSLKIKFPHIELAQVKELPMIVEGVLNGLRSNFTGALESIQSLWKRLHFELPHFNLNGLEIVQETFNAAVGTIKGAWEKVTNLDNAPLLSKTIGFVKSLPEIFEASVQKITAIWSTLSEKFSGVLGGMAEKSKSVGKKFVSFLSENSPGPTYQIRTKWTETVGSIKGNLEGLATEAKVQGQKIAGHLDGKGFHSLGRSASSLGMALSNISPQLAMPLFAIGDLVDTSQTLSETLPQAKKFFTSLGPEALKLKGTIGELIPTLGPKLASGIGQAGSSIKTLIPLIGSGLSTAMATIVPIAISIGSSIVAMAGTAIAAITPLIIPFLPIVAAIGLVIGAVALLKAAFNSDFLGIKTMVEGVAGAINEGFVGAFNMVQNTVIGAIGFISDAWSGFTGFIVASFLAIPNAIGGAISSLVPSFLKKAPEKQQAESTPENGMIGAAGRIKSAWSGFGDWFGGSMDGMVGKGVDAGDGLVNALNHNPTVRIPIAWEGATSRIGGMLSGMLKFAGVIGNGLSSLFGGAIGGISKAFMGLGLTGALSMLPLLPIVAAVGLGIFAVSQNILGLKTIVLAVASTLSGLAQGFMAAFGGLFETIKGIGTVIQGAMTGDINIMAIGVDRVLSGLRSTFNGIGFAIRSIFGGAIGFVQGLFEAFGTRSSALFQSLASGVSSFFASPINAIMALIDSVEVKIRSVGEAITRSPIGTMARGLGFKGRGEAQTVEGGVDIAQFDNQIAAVNPTPITPQITPAIQGAAENLKSNIAEGLNSAQSAVGALGSVLGLLSPALAAPLMIISGLLSAVTTVTAAIPILSGSIASLTGATGLFATASGFASTALTFLSSTATAAWLAISGPLLPIIAGIAAVAVGVNLLAVAFENNFLGIGSLFNAIGDGIGEIFVGIKSAWDGAVGGIMVQLNILGQTILEPFKPLIAMFSGGGEMAGVGTFISDVLLIPFNTLATAIGFAIGTIGKAIEAVIVIGTVITDILLQPIRAIVGVVGQVVGAIGGMVQAIISPFAQVIDTFSRLGASIQGTGIDSIGFGQIISAIANTVLMPLRIVFWGISKAIEGVGLVLSGIIVGFTLLAQVILLPVNAIAAMVSGVISLGQIIGSVLMAPFQMVGTIVDGFINSILSIPSIVSSALASIPFFGGILTALAPQQEVQHFAVGGQVLGNGGIDKEPAMLTAGEFVMQNSAVGAIGLNALEAMNSGDMPGAMTAMMKYLPPIPQMLFPAPIPVPVASGGDGVGSGGINLSLNVASISVVAPQGDQGGDTTRAMMMDLLDQLMPHLDRAVSDILRTKAELVR